MNTFSPHNSNDVPFNDIQQTEDSEIQYFPALEVKKGINKLKLKKATGFGLISAEILRQLPSNVLPTGK